MERFIRGVNMKYTSFDTVMEEMTDMELMIEREMTSGEVEDVPKEWKDRYLMEIDNEILERGL